MYTGNQMLGGEVPPERGIKKGQMKVFICPFFVGRADSTVP